MAAYRLASVALLGTLAMATLGSPAKADWDDHGWHHGHWHRWGHWGPPPPAYYPPPRPYYPPPVVYAPPPPPPAFYAPGIVVRIP